MTTLEIILILVIWIGYGLWAAYQTKSCGESPLETLDDPGGWFAILLIVIISPYVFIYRAIYGAFRRHDLD